MKTGDFLRRYAYVYLYVAAFFLGCAGLMRQAVETAGEMAPFSACPVILIDAGHGGPDGGHVLQVEVRAAHAQAFMSLLPQNAQNVLPQHACCAGDQNFHQIASVSCGIMYDIIPYPPNGCNTMGRVSFR
jgi:hypothetical protein